MPYVATVSVPGYLPDTDRPTIFDTVAEAWDYLASERERDYDGLDQDSDRHILESQAHVGSCRLHTPGYTGHHDLGIVYSVSEATRKETHYDGCPGLGECDQAWHDDGCEDYWQYLDSEGFDITGDPLDYRDAVEKRLWQGPDEPSEVWTRPATGRPWVRNDID